MLAAEIAPQLLLLLVGGAVADRFSRRAVLIAANLGAGLTQGTVALVLLTGHYSLPLVVGLELGNGAMAAFASPALRGVVPELVPADDLQRANSVLASTRNATRILGPTAAGLIVVGFGGGWAIAVDALSYLAATGFLARLPRRTGRMPSMRSHLLSDIRHGWREFRSIRWVSTVALSYCVINLVNVGPWQILGPTLTRSRSGEAAWGMVLSVRAVGLLVMSVLMYRLVFRRPLRAGRLAGALPALPLLALGLGAGAPALAACAFVGALGLTVSGVTWDTAIQQHVPREVLSRVSSYDDLLSYAAIPVGQLLVGPAAAYWGGAHVALACGIAYLAAALAPLLVRSVRQLPNAAARREQPARV
ncbi:MFS transporter [Actinocatenispora thailandica]|uniref:MFS transporter n=1 Tax=Actinocatenispora thailandica TaxID=227318 RepID=A0A7R7DVI8_9ACTN|nr:MFS transporter [Actinocatenispora thailandica]BCJ38581.1 MFS transporter [Actinocatenispora thailandica]